MLPDNLVADYCQQFFGFGSWSAKVWFIGLEEGGGWNEADVQGRLSTWQAGGRRSLEDAPEFYPTSKCHKWHGDDAKLQTTWKQLIRMLFIAQGKGDSDDAILKYQRKWLGAFSGETCLAELFPLPSPNTRTWLYSEWSNLVWLKERKTYEARTMLSRACSLKRKIEENKPKVVIFYGATRLRSWSQISGGYFEQAIDGQLMRFKSDATMFFVTRHPAWETDEYFKKIGRFFRRHYGSSF